MKVRGQIRRPFCEITKEKLTIGKDSIFLTNETIIKESNGLTSNRYTYPYREYSFVRVMKYVAPWCFTFIGPQMSQWLIPRDYALVALPKGLWLLC